MRGGTTTGDSLRFRRTFWEIDATNKAWALQQGTVDSQVPYGGREYCLLWEDGSGALSKLTGGLGATIAGRDAWGRNGIAITYTRSCTATLYTGELYENVICVAIPKKPEDLPVLWSFAKSGELYNAVRLVNQKLSVDVRYFEKAPIDLSAWRTRASEELPNFEIAPFSGDPTQWLFHGHPQPSTDPLQVAVARLSGYRWPAETDTAMELADEARTWIARCDKLAEHTDDDGIVCLPSVRGEAPAHDLNTVLRQLQLQFFSQGELSRMTNGAQGQAQVLALIDTAAGASLLELKATERDLKARLKALFQSTRDAARLQAEVAEAQQEAVELERQLKAREAVQEDSQLNQLALEARRHLNRMKSADAPVVEAVNQVLQQLGTPLEPLSASADNWPNAAWFKGATTQMEQARADLAAAITNAMTGYQQAMAACLGEGINTESLHVAP